MKASDLKDRKTLGGTDESSSGKSCSPASQDCDRGNDSYEFSGGVGRSLELVDGDDNCVEPDGKKRLIDSVIVDQSRSWKSSEESPEWGNAEKEVDRSGGRPAGIGNCNEEL